MGKSLSRPPTLGTLIEDRPIEAIEQLDSAIRIVGVRGWLVLAAVGMTMAAFGVFSWFYEVPLKVDGRGIILASDTGEGGPLLQVTAPASGRLIRVAARIGAEVKVGEVLAEIDQGETRDRIQEAEAELVRLLEDDAAMTRFDETESASRDETTRRLEETLRRNLQHDNDRLAIHRRVEAADRSLQRRQLLNDIDALKSRTDTDAVEAAAGEALARIQGLDLDRVEDRIRRRREKLRRTLAVKAAEIRLSLLRERLARDTRVVSPYHGTIVDLMITPHALIEKGTPAALLQPSTLGAGPMEAIVFVPAGTGKKVRMDDEVQVVPDTVRRQEHGFVRGVVRSASAIPATELAMLAELKHKTLVASFREQYAGRTLLIVRVHLPEAFVPDGDRVRSNRLAWSSSSGASQRVSSGTLCSASIVVERRPLIALALPWAKQLAGLE
jgi:HlyD family secretion protein